MSPASIRCAPRLRQSIGEPGLRDLGEESGFCKRRRKLTGFRAVWVFATALASGATRTIADIVRVFVELTEQSIAYKAFHVRLANRSFPAFMRSVFETLVERSLEPVLQSRTPLLRSFEDIVVHDGSSFAVNDDLRSTFPDRFTTISPGAVEVHCTYSLYQGQPLSLTIAADKEAERQFLPAPEQVARKLILLDRGYVWYEYFRQVVEAGGHFIVRARDNRFNPRIVKCFRGLSSPSQVAGKRLGKIDIPKNNVDLLVEGDEWKGGRYRYRLVLFYVHRNDRHIRLQTSLDPREYRPSRVAELYRLRWQVELFFKECKSYTCLRKFQTKNPQHRRGPHLGDDDRRVPTANDPVLRVSRDRRTAVDLHRRVDELVDLPRPGARGLREWSFTPDRARARADPATDSRRENQSAAKEQLRAPIDRSRFGLRLTSNR